MKYYFHREATPPVKRITYPIKRFNGIDARTDENSLNPSYAKYGYNVAFTGGTMYNAQGIKDPEFRLTDGTLRTLPVMPSPGLNVERLFVYKRNGNGMADDRLIAFMSNGKFYECAVASDGYAEIPNMVADTDKDVCFLNYYMNGKDMLIVSTGVQGGLYVYDGTTVTQVTGAPALSSLCMHYDRLFGHYGHTVHFSKLLDPTDWSVSATTGGNISLMDEGGAIQKLVSFKGYIFVFREHAVTRLTAYTDPYDYTLTKAIATEDRINRDTIAVAEDYILFLADKTVFRFDGYYLKEIMERVTPLIEGHVYANAVIHKKVYYLAVKMRKEGTENVGDEKNNTELKNNAIFYSHVETGDGGITRGLDVKQFVPLISGNVSEVLTIFNTARRLTVAMLSDENALYDKALPKLWVSAEGTLGYAGKTKILRRAYATSRYPLTLKAKLAGTETTREVHGGIVPERLSINAVGETVGLRIEALTPKLCVSDLTLECDLTRRYYGN